MQDIYYLPVLSNPKKENYMWLVFFIVALLFVLGNALILFRTAKTSKVPDNVKAQPYEKDDSSGW